MATELRNDPAAMVLLLTVAVGDRLEVDGGNVWSIVPFSGERGREPVPLAVLDAIEEAGWLVHDAAGSHVTERGLYHLRRWGRSAFGKRWELVEGTFTNANG